jgi:hypothetical protein
LTGDEQIVQDYLCLLDVLPINGHKFPLATDHYKQ